MSEIPTTAAIADAAADGARGRGGSPGAPGARGRSGTGEWARASWIQAGRALKRALRMPPVVIQSIAFPVVLMLLLVAGFSEVVGDFDTSRPYVQRLVPLIAITGALFGGLANGSALIAERTSGLLDRFRTMPSPQSAPLTGRAIAEAGRIAISTVIVLVVAFVIGFRAGQGVAGLLAFVLVTVAYGVSFTWPVMALAVRARSLEQMSLLSPFFLLLLFLNTGFVPLDAFPGALQPVVRNAPHTVATEALIGLTDSGPIAGPLLATAVWCAVLTAIFAPLTVRRA